MTTFIIIVLYITVNSFFNLHIVFSADNQNQAKVSCVVPHVSQDKTFAIFDSYDQPISIENGTAGSKVPRGAYINVQCTEGYLLSNGNNSSTTLCHGIRTGEWIPPIEPCRRRRRCGIPHDETLTLDGKNATLGQLPWHVAIYRKGSRRPDEHIQICSGTLISTNVVLSAAHCFYNEARNVPATNSTHYIIVVGKITRNYEKIDNQVQKTYEISEILLFDKPYYDPTYSFANDIALIVLKKEVMTSTFVFPACYETGPNSHIGFNPGNGKKGVLASWRKDNSSNSTESLTLIQLPFLNLHDCRRKLSDVTMDKFCTGGEQGTIGLSPQIGDSGGGLVFKDYGTSVYYLRGIVSTTDSLYSTEAIAPFTDISYYVQWIDGVLQEKSENQLDMV